MRVFFLFFHRKIFCLFVCFPAPVLPCQICCQAAGETESLIVTLIIFVLNCIRSLLVSQGRLSYEEKFSLQNHCKLFSKVQIFLLKHLPWEVLPLHASAVLLSPPVAQEKTLYPGFQGSLWLSILLQCWAALQLLNSILCSESLAASATKTQQQLGRLCYLCWIRFRVFYTALC